MTSSKQQIPDKNTGQYNLPTQSYSPIRSLNLKHFLDVSLNPHSNIEEIAAAVERDPYILASFLKHNIRSINSIECWFDGVEMALFPAIAMAMCSDFISRSNTIVEEQKKDSWRNSIYTSLLAEHVCQRLDPKASVQAKLAGLLANISEIMYQASLHVQPVELHVNTIARESNNCAKQSADMLKAWGCTSSFCDAIRYHQHPLEDLESTSGILISVAIASRLVKYIDKPDSLTKKDSAQFQTFGITNEDIHEFIKKTNTIYHDRIYKDADRKSIHHELLNTFNDAALSGIFNSVLANTQQEERIKISADCNRYLYSITKIHNANVVNDNLEIDFGVDIIRISCQCKKSLLAKCYQLGDIESIYPENASSIHDSQILERTDNEALLCIPINSEQGILVCEINRSALKNIQTKPHLLHWLCHTNVNLQSNHSNLSESAETSQLENEIRERINKLVHEANNPFSIIQNYLHSLSFKLGQDSPLQKEIEIITAEISRTSDIISSFKDIGNSGKKTLLASVNINNLLQELINLFQGSNKKINFSIELYDDIDEIESKPDDIKQIIINLLKNAIESFENFSPKQKKPKITIATFDHVNVSGNSFQEIIISDNGPGIPDEMQKDLFRKKQSTKTLGHSGLGLNIVNELIERINAMITCKSRNGEIAHTGTTFSILIPKTSIKR